MRLRLVGTVVLLLACASHPTAAKEPSARDFLREAAAHYKAYGAALKESRREALARFYSPQGVLLVVNGAERTFTQQSLDSTYRHVWPGFAFFAWDTLHYQLLDERNTVVTGSFLMQRTSVSDTIRVLYLGILQAADSGLVIRVEHETALPRQR